MADVTIETLQPMSFAGIRFPFERRTYTGSGRFHTHIFPHSNGGENEKQGRELYKINVVCQFHDRPGEDMADIYGDDLYSFKLPLLRGMWELQVTRDFVVPGLGTLQAFCTNWTATLDAKITSGEEVVLEFIEDDDVSFGELRFSQQAMANAAALLTTPLPEMPQVPSIFQQINDLVGTLDQIKAVGQIANALLEAKLIAIVDLCANAESSVAAIQDPLNFPVLNALKAVALAAAEWVDNINANATPIGFYTTSKTMSLSDISIAIYKDATHIEELLDLNAIEDDVAIPAGSSIRFYIEG